jgi:hypothetical protein
MCVVVPPFRQDGACQTKPETPVLFLDIDHAHACRRGGVGLQTNRESDKGDALRHARLLVDGKVYIRDRSKGAKVVLELLLTQALDPAHKCPVLVWMRSHPSTILGRKRNRYCQASDSMAVAGLCDRDSVRTP